MKYIGLTLSNRIWFYNSDHFVNREHCHSLHLWRLAREFRPVNRFSTTTFDVFLGDLGSAKGRCIFD
jgi:hypothetical protein